MATDTYRFGAFVQHTLIYSETSDNMRSAVHALQMNNPCWTRVMVLVIDKDFAELSLFRETFLCATVILCQFHVIDHLYCEVSMHTYRFTEYQVTHLRNLVRLAVYSNTEEEFERRRNREHRKIRGVHELL